MFGSLTNLSLIVQILSVIILITTGLTLVIAVFSYVGYKIRQKRKPQELEEIPDFFWRYTPELFIPPPQALAAPATFPPPAGPRFTRNGSDPLGH